MKTIYLISTTSDGAARTRSETMARAFEQASDYHRCTRDQYYQRMREIKALDLPTSHPGTPPEPTETDRTASDLASSTPAGTPATPLARRQQPRQQEGPP